MSKVQRSIRLSPECDEALRVMAERQGRSVSQLIDRLVQMQFIGQPGARSSDGRENARTKAARERGLYWPEGERASKETAGCPECGGRAFRPGHFQHKQSCPLYSV